jgi:hypothetical protein
VTDGARCPVCGRQVPARDHPHGGRTARYCSGACKAKAYRARQQAGEQRPGTPPISPAGRHARVIEIRQQVSGLVGDMADTASGQQALFASPGTARRRARAAETARTLHRLIAELATLATATITERVTIRQPPGGTTQTMPLFDEGGNDG